MLNMVDWRSSLLLLISFVYGGLGDVQFQWKFHPTVNPVVKDGKRSGESMPTPSTPLITPKRPPTGTAFPISANSDCEDTPSANCSLYNTTIICDSKGIYYLWARKNCRLHCGFCQKSCKDDPSANCALYNATALCDPNGMYYGWARSNCTAYCGLCQGTTTSLPPSVITSSQPSYPSEVCKDTLNCRLYPAAIICITNGIYYPWSLKHCPAYCGYCQAPTRIVPCSDKLTNCDEYPPDLCSNEIYRLWREDNCRKFCGICSGTTTSLPSTVNTSSQPSYPSEVCRLNNPSMICVTNDVYYPWSLKHCPAYCEYCLISDKLTNCDEYPTDVCTNENYRLLRKDNCRKSLEYVQLSDT